MPAPAADGSAASVTAPSPELPLPGAPSQDLPPPIASVRRQSTKVPPKIEPLLKDETAAAASDLLKNVLATTPAPKPDALSERPATPQANSTEALLARLKVAQKLSADKVIDQPDKPSLATPEALNNLMRKMSGLVANLTPKDDPSKKYTALGAVPEGDVTA